ncbi:recombinase family protein [Streptomyces sp. NPDC000609]|uniref:recombinase family protein n=1 Tax=Streptomyces sp. NPDC000609 TaxID=3160957 RepID=UPI003390F7C9
MSVSAGVVVGEAEAVPDVVGQYGGAAVGAGREPGVEQARDGGRGRLLGVGRSPQDLLNMVAELRKREIGFISLHERLDTTTPGGRLIFHVLAALTEFVREPIVQGMNEGLAAARTCGRVGGRPNVVNDKLLRAARDMLPNPENSIETNAARLGVSVGTLYNHIPDLKELRASRVPHQLESGQR